jgi:hypothetical protein
MNRLFSGANAWYNQQQSRVASYTTPSFEIPTDWNCAGECTQPVPDPPAGSTNESFRSNSGQQHRWIVVMSVAALAYAGLTLGRKK